MRADDRHWIDWRHRLAGAPAAVSLDIAPCSARAAVQDDMKRHFSPREIVEIVVVVAGGMRMLDACSHGLDVPLEAEAHRGGG
jgi:hypothetical protein